MNIMIPSEFKEQSIEVLKKYGLITQIDDVEFMRDVLQAYFAINGCPVDLDQVYAYYNTPKPVGIRPLRIVKFEDTEIEYAEFEYYTGKRYCKENGIHQLTSGDNIKINHGTHYIVTCGIVMIRVDESLFPDMERDILRETDKL